MTPDRYTENRPELQSEVTLSDWHTVENELGHIEDENSFNMTLENWNESAQEITEQVNDAQQRADLMYRVEELDQGDRSHLQ